MFYKFLDYLNSLKLSTYFLVPTSYSFGNICEQIKLAALECEKKNKKLIIIPPSIFKKLLKFEIANHYLLNNIIIKQKKTDIVINNFNKKSFFYHLIFNLLNFEFLLRRSTALLLKFLLKVKLREINFFPVIGFPKFVFHNKHKITKENILTQNFEKLEINIEKSKQEVCNKVLSQKGINHDTKFVCIHLRDGAYKNDFNRRTERNIDINNYYKMIKYLISKNYFVIRIGQTQKHKIEIKEKEFIDYPFSNIKSEFMDLYLIKNCKFFVGNLSGPLEAAYMFDKPCLALDVNKVFEAFPRHKLSRSVFKNLYFKKSNKKIPFKEFINLDLKFHHWKFIDNSIEYKSLNEDEILKEVINYVSLIENNEFKLKQSQVKFNEYLLNNLIYKANNLKIKNQSSNIIEDIEYYNKKLFLFKKFKRIL